MAAGYVVIGEDHGLGSLLQMPEALRLSGDAAGDLTNVAGHIRQLDSEAADPVRELVDQPIAR